MCQNIFCAYYHDLRKKFDANISYLIMYHLSDEIEKHHRETNFIHLKNQIGPFNQTMDDHSSVDLSKQPLVQSQLLELYNIIEGRSSALFALENHNIKCILSAFPGAGWVPIAICGCKNDCICLFFCIDEDQYGSIKVGRPYLDAMIDRIYNSLHEFALDWITLNDNDIPTNFCKLLKK